MITILVTGSTGLLGSSLVPHLKKAGFNVVTHAYSTQADVMFDLSDRQKSYEALEKIQPNVIINLVGLTNVELCEKELNLAYLLNTRTVENLAFCISSFRTGCHLVHISTDHVYDGKSVHSEDSVNLTNSYAFSKYAGELAAMHVPSTILRTNFVGRSMAAHRESLTDWVYKSISNKKDIQVLSDIYFSPLSIKILIDMIEIVVKKKPKGVYNLGSNNGMSKAEFCFSFAEHLNLTTSTMTRIDSNEAIFFKAYRPKDMRMDNAKFESTLGIKLPDLTDIIQQLTLDYNEFT